MGDWKPLIFMTLTLLVLGLGIPVFAGYFIQLDPDTIVESSSSLVLPLASFVDSGITIFTFTINPFSLLGTTLKNYLTASLLYVGLLPDIIIVLLLVLTLLGFVYSLIKLLPTT